MAADYGWERERGGGAAAGCAEGRWSVTMGRGLGNDLHRASMSAVETKTNSEGSSCNLSCAEPWNVGKSSGSSRTGRGWALGL